jgi:hypothetical protein
MKLSREFIIGIKLNELPAYRIAQRAGIHPNTLSKMIKGAERIRPADERVLSVAAVLGLQADACFEPEPRQEAVPA